MLRRPYSYPSLISILLSIFHPHFNSIPPSGPAPGEPTIHGYDASERVKIGSVFNLTCSSGGGFPHAKLTWFKNGEVVPSETFQEAGESAAVVEVTVEGPENETEYLCRAHNFVAGFSASVVVRAEQGEASNPGLKHSQTEKI